MRKFRVTLWTCQICAHFMHLASTKCKMLSVMPRWIQHSLRCIWVSKFVNLTVFFERFWHEVECLWMSWHCSCSVSFFNLNWSLYQKATCFQVVKTYSSLCPVFCDTVFYNVGVWQARKVLRKKRNKKGLKYLLIEQRQDKSDKIKQ